MPVPSRAALIDALAAEIADHRVLGALAHVPRDRFVTPELRSRAWEDAALPIGRGQTISQPSLVAGMCEALELRGEETVLDVGTGSGYHAALLSRLCARVVSVERDPVLLARAEGCFVDAGVTGVELVLGDAIEVVTDEQSYDAINVAAAAAPDALEALALRMRDGGRMVVPRDDGGEHQRLVRIRRSGDRLEQEDLGPVSFVPLIRGGA